MRLADIPGDTLIAQCRIDSPLGPLTLAATGRGLAAALFDAQKHHPGEMALPDAPQHPHLALAAAEFAAYFADAKTVFTVPLDPQGSPFQQDVWKLLLGIAPGRLSTYGQIARQLGNGLGAQGARAVGSAVGRNPVAIIVPCHRVVGHDGSLTGYAAGLPRKEFLLQHEGVLQRQPQQGALI
jgi:methylated-DNA-[protein]-cysteine S-methyltransferase